MTITNGGALVPGGSRFLQNGSQLGKPDKTFGSVMVPAAARAALERAGSVERGCLYVTREEAHAAAGHCRRRRHRLLVMFLWVTGCRISEALAVTPSDLDTRTNVVHLQTLKRRKPTVRAVPVSEAFLAELIALTHRRGRGMWAPPEAGERLWPVTRQHAHETVRRALMAAGVEAGRATPKALRHGHCIHGLRSGASLDLVAKNVGHANVVTTSHYLRATATDVRAAYSKIDW